MGHHHSRVGCSPAAAWPIPRAASTGFDIRPDVTPPQWAEVRFDFPDPEVLVLDAVPTRVVEPTRATSYQLTAQLRFAAVESSVGTGADFTLPALVPAIAPFGIDSGLIGWRHAGQVPPGTHVGWLVLLVPESWTEVPVLATGHYHVETAADLQLRPDARQDAFTIRLPARHRRQLRGGQHHRRGSRQRSPSARRIRERQPAAAARPANRTFPRSLSQFPATSHFRCTPAHPK